ncbi:hypothetical protein DFH94DRAFT_714342 [Russula ochroleuca]|uniref:Ubiquitin-like domain-containing protein n=1 Tax=Russula ochroleuca TaxID=152965 RepID=A0A9P5N286_9AGAM|nr:hypothetical protein DFH94DRAFT_714342 [Russula ochroleuca]
MSLLIRVELPTYSHSFQVSVPSIGTISDVKREIESVCVGNPRVPGQRLIWRGRFLGDDEKVLDIWKSPSDVPVVHLSVHPSAWASAPPSIATTAVNPIPPATTTTTTFPPPPHTGHNVGGDISAPTPPPSMQHSDPSPRTVQPGASPTPVTLPATTSVPGLAPISVGYINYVAYQHLSAASVLRSGRLAEDSPPAGLAESKNLAKQLMTQWGYQWPSVFDEEYPPAQDESAGIKYEPVTIDGEDYLRLVDPSRTPTPLQAHALRVLERTFALFAMPLPSSRSFPIPPPSQANTHLPVHVNAHLQQIGLPPLRVRQENAMIAELRAVPMRALAGPLLMLTLRTLFLLYFFSPFQKPVFGMIVTAWLLYETWNTIRNAIPRLHVRGALADDAAMRPPEAAVAPNVPLRAAPVPPHRTPMQRHRPASETLMDSLASVNLQVETSALDSRPDAMAVPTVGYRIKTFIQLLVLTAHPAIWDRRRAALRQREGRVRTEMNALEMPAQTEGNGDGRSGEVRARAQAQHLRRAAWVAEYMERVRGGGDWMDDQ